VIFKDKKELLWAKGSHLSTIEPIGSRRGGLYVVTGQLVQALAHDAVVAQKTWTSSFQSTSRSVEYGMWHALYFS
jgi:hypothetical protein